MAFHDHIPQELSFQPFTDDQQQQQQLTHHQNRDMQRLLPFSSSSGSGGAPTWMGSGGGGGTPRQQNFLHLPGESGEGNNWSTTTEELAEYKADILGHPLYEQLLSAHVSCLRIATPVDQLPRIDAQLQQSQRVLEKYSGIGNGVIDEKELDQFMVIIILSLSL